MPKESVVSSKSDPAQDLLDQYSPLKVAKIFPTNYKRKPIYLETYRPKENQCLDYHLSETNVRWDVGDTKVRARQLRADYVLAPPGYVSKKPPQYSSAGPPCWRWLDEIWREKMAKRNEKYKALFAEYVKSRRDKVIKDRSRQVNFTYKVDVPLWFQELSFRQMMIIDNLQWCINMDLHLNIIEHTKDNLLQLGLMLRANSKAIKIALRFCCANDVEFLLVLYQISNPKRVNYSINDRLLLSAVYHLCITETLRELHVRIPSPPREGKKKIIPEPPKRPRKEKYDSPYLEPYTFIRPPRKDTGIYKKQIIQYPESPYFSYLPDLYLQIANSMDPRDMDAGEVEDPKLAELLEEMQQAQELYSRLPHKTPKNIVAPTIKDRCTDFLQQPKPSPPPPEEKPPKKEPKACLPPLPELPLDEDVPCVCDSESKFDEQTEGEEEEPKFEPITLQNIPCDECPENECDCKRLARRHMKSFCRRCSLQKRFKQRIVMQGSKRMEDGTTVPVIGGYYKEKECQCLERYQNRWEALDKGERMERDNTKYTITGVSYTPAGACYIVQSIIPPEGMDRYMAEDLRPCGFAICECEEMERPKTLVEVPIPELKPSPIMPWEKVHCTCKDELQKFLELQCHCPDCEEQRRLQNRDMIVSGTKRIICDSSDGKSKKPVDLEEDYAVNVPIVQGLQDLHCDCLKRYKKHLKKLEEYKQRVKARIVMRAREHKYNIAGVTLTKDGPVYQIQGMRTPVKCICAEIDAEMREEEEQKKRMPKMPPTGRASYAIGGVSAGPCTGGTGENLFILTSALGNKPCKCHKLYEIFEEEHKNCMDYFEEYMKKTMDDILAYEMEEAKKREKRRKKEARLRGPEPPPPPPPPPERSGICEGPCEAKKPCPCVDAEPDNFDNIKSFRRESDSSTEVSELFSSLGSNECDCVLNKMDEKVEKDLPPCNPEAPSPPKPQPQPQAPPPPPEPEPEESDLKRYVILEKIPSDESEMLAIITKCLEVMAEDGFALAKLPECNKLPIFKLWIYLRQRKKWLWEERPPYNPLSRDMFEAAKCHWSMIPPVLPISKKKASKLTWAHANYVKSMVESLTDEFYRSIKKRQIENMRAIFPATFNYEFPEFRQCFFCYLPSKEEDVLFTSLA